MHISCPSCQTVFAVDDDLFPAGGSRKVRCSVCEHIWQTSAANSVDVAASVTESAPQASASPDYPNDHPNNHPDTSVASPKASPFPDTEIDRMRPPRSGGISRSRQKSRRLPRPLTMMIAGSAIFAIMIGGAVIWRNIVSAIFPSTIAIYETVGLPVMPDTSVIRFEAIRGERNGDTVRIRGEVVNNGIWPTHAPPIFISVQDMIGSVLAVKEVELDKLIIPAGGRLPLNVQLTLDKPLRADVDTEIVAIPVARMPGNRQ
jgi:predicted Zn finger-like uncharacterized protein